jgi:hypothetical protein
LRTVAGTAPVAEHFWAGAVKRWRRLEEWGGRCRWRRRGRGGRG